MSGDLVRFYAWMRRGLAAAATTVDGDGRIVADVGVSIAGDDYEQSVALRGPEAVAGLAATEVSRTTPRDGARDFEPSYFAAVELRSPDLPWLFTPAPTGGGPLPPWLVLVVVEERPGVRLTHPAGRPASLLTIDDGAAGELPPLADAWAWAHVQCDAPSEGDLTEAVRQDRGAFRARLVCPRRLVSETSYIACVVPAYETGRLAGLGQDPGPLRTDWAWTQPDAIELPVFFAWRFGTTEDGDFEALAKRLSPHVLGPRVGVVPLDLSAPGAELPAGPEVDWLGALTAPDVDVRPWEDPHRTDMTDALEARVNGGAGAGTTGDGAYDALRDDPVVTLPLYGGAPAATAHVPGEGVEPVWLREANTHPAHRSAAGLGAEVVRRHQETIMADAWNQVSGVRRAEARLQRGLLAAEVGEKLAQRVARLDDGAFLQLSRPAHARTRSGPGTVHARLSTTEVPTGLVTAAFRRLTRHGSPAARALGVGVEQVALSGAVAETFTVDPDAITGWAVLEMPRGAEVYDESIMQFTVGSGDDARTYRFDANLRSISELSPRRGRRRTVPRGVTRRLPGPASAGAWPGRHEPKLVESPFTTTSVKVRLHPSRPVRTPAPGPATPTATGALVTELRGAVSPRAAVAQRLSATLIAPAGTFAGDALPTRLTASPSFDYALADWLAKIEPRTLLPGFEQVPADSVSLLRTNTAFVESFLLGANHELSRELLWREYPTDLTGTWLRQFWNAVGDVPDIGEVSGWLGGARLGDSCTGAGAGGAMVLLVRGELVRRYPDLIVYAVEADVDPTTGARREKLGGRRALPAFVGSLADDTIFVGLGPEISFESALGNADSPQGWFIVLEEHPSRPRFGLDVGESTDPGSVPSTWQDVSWLHLLAEGQTEADLPAHVPVAGRLHDGVARPLASDIAAADAWGTDAAAMARITFQRPVRMLVHAPTLLESPDPA